MERRTEAARRTGRVANRAGSLVVTATAFVVAAVALGAASGCGGRAAAQGPRQVVVTIHHSAFNPSRVMVRPGETVRFVVRNTDPIDHELILGNEAVQQHHEAGTEMRHGAVPGEVSVPAGDEASTTYTFTLPRPLEYACHLPGHYTYGMRGLVVVTDP